MIDLKSLTPSELEGFVAQIKEPKFRAKQIFKWLYRGVTSFDEMTDLSKVLRGKLEKESYINVLEIEQKQVAKDGTIKYLFKLMDGKLIESVLMEYHHGNTICISSQVGCAMGCKFCATGLGGRERNMTPSEIIDQIIFAQKDSGKPINNIVMMGMGEPLDNYENVLKFLEIVNAEDGLNIGMRHISLSTCGVCDKIDALAEKKLGLTLSVSLHAFSDEMRTQIMPINKKYNIKRLMQSCKNYIEKTGRRISFEYALIDGQNDSEENAQQLAKLLKGFLCHVNLIPINEVDGTNFKKSSKQRVYKFQEILVKNGINATIRRTLGGDIDASCGQLKGKHQK